MAGVLPKGCFHQGGFSVGFLRTAFSSLSTSLTSLRTAARTGGLTPRVVPVSRDGRQTIGPDHWDIYQMEALSEGSPAAGGLTGGRAFIGKKRWDLEERTFVPTPLTESATGVAHFQRCFKWGAERFAYYCTEVDCEGRPVGPKLVAKTPLHEEELSDPSFHKRFCKAQEKAQAHALLFNRRVQGMETKPALDLRFVECSVFTVRDWQLAWHSQEGHVDFSAEPELEGRFRKFTTNWGCPQPPAGGRTCVICLTSPRETRFACGHSCLCATCLETFLHRAST